MTKALRVHHPGGPNALTWDDVEAGNPGVGEVRLRHSAIGVNFLDTFHRRQPGLFPSYPAVIGVEGAGHIEAVGTGVADFAVGDRAAYALSRGSYAQVRLIDAAALVRIPHGINDETAAAGLTKGITVHHLFNGARKIVAGEKILFHAAAGGVGLIACQWARHIGATLIGTAGSDEKAALIKSKGAAHAIVYTREDFAERVMEITKDRGCDAVFDSVGKDTIEGSLKCVAKYGTLATYGAASGPGPELTSAQLPISTTFARASIRTLVALPDLYRAAAAEFFALVADGAISVEINQRYALEDGARAHADLEARKTTGSTILVP